jgi:uncharacterized OsmC-like protein
MPARDIAAALKRVESVLQRRPQAGLGDDTTATVRWQGGTRLIACHPSGAEVTTDMPVEVGGSGDRITPGWLFRAGLAGCGATCIALVAAAEGVDLDELEVSTATRSDTRGMLGMTEADGRPVSAAARDFRLNVRIAARGVAPDRLRALARRGLDSSPAYAALSVVLPIELQIDVKAV